jgi:hypothetical protein
VTAAIILFFVGVGLLTAVIDPYGLYDLFTIPGINAYKSEARYNEKFYKCLTRNELSDSSELWLDGCGRQTSRHNMWTEITRRQYQRKGLRYASDVTEASGA